MLLAASVLLAIFVSCSEQPDDPRFDNPLDPTLGADPFGVAAEFTDGAIRVTWADIVLQAPGITGYSVLHSLSAVGPFNVISSLALDELFLPRFDHTGYERDATNFYKVVATRGAEISSESIVVAASSYAPPSTQLVSGDVSVAQRMAALRLRPRVRGTDVVEISLDAGFSAPSSHDSAEVAEDIIFDLGARSEGESILLFTRVASGGQFSPVGRDSMVVVMPAELSVPQQSTAIVDTHIVVEAEPLDGIAQWRIARSEAELASASWTMVEEDLGELEFNLDADSLMQNVWGEFESSFGFRATRSVRVVATGEIGEPTFMIESGDSTTANEEVTIAPINAAGAAYMRFSEDINFAGVPWVPIDIFYSLTLSSGTGTKTVYGLFSNPYTDEVESGFDTILRVGP
jgi:hypothetical protein